MWCVEDGSRRRRLSPAFFGAVAESYLVFDETYAVDEGVAPALWAPPGAADDQQLPPRSARSWAKTQRLFGVLGLMEEKHPVEARTTTYSYSCSAPGRDGKGAGSGRP
jgi:hypothetical protein